MPKFTSTPKWFDSSNREVKPQGFITVTDNDPDNLPDEPGLYYCKEGFLQSKLPNYSATSPTTSHYIEVLPSGGLAVKQTLVITGGGGYGGGSYERVKTFSGSTGSLVWGGLVQSLQEAYV